MHLHKPYEYCDPDCPPLDWPLLVQSLLSILPDLEEYTKGGKDWQHAKHVAEVAEGYLKTNRRYGR